jgi:hypothetical protein
MLIATSMVLVVVALLVARTRFLAMKIFSRVWIKDQFDHSTVRRPRPGLHATIFKLPTADLGQAGAQERPHKRRAGLLHTPGTYGHPMPWPGR